MVTNMGADTPDSPDTPNRWIDDRLRALDPPDTWEPAPAVALARFRQRAEAETAAAATTGLLMRWRRRRLVYATESSGHVPPPVSSGVHDVLAALRAPVSIFKGGWRAPLWITAATWGLLLLLLTPTARAGAQRLWDTFFAQRVEFVTLDIDKLPRSFTDQHVRMIGPTQLRVGSPQQAAEHARFTPRLPAADAPSVDGATPKLAVSGTISLEWRVNVADLDDAARRAGLTDVTFPREWDGATIGAHTGPLVIASYPNFELVQLMPLALTTPPGFDVGAFTEGILRIGGMSRSAARTFSAQMTAAPFALFAVSRDEAMNVRQVTLRSGGQGTLVHDFKDDGGLERTTLVWSTADRLYTISSSLSDDEVIAIADAVPQP